MFLRVKSRDKKKVKILMKKAMTKSKKENMVKIRNRLNNQRVIRTIINNLEKVQNSHIIKNIRNRQKVSKQQ